jgi:hypothetical protein
LRFELLITILAPLNFSDDVISEAVDYNAVFTAVGALPTQAHGVSALRYLLDADAVIVAGLPGPSALRLYREEV